MIVLVAYDVSDDRDRSRLGMLLSHSGVRLQRSLFECDLNGQGIDYVLEKGRSLLALNRDVMHLFPQCEDCRKGRRSIGQAPGDLDEDYWIV